MTEVDFPTQYIKNWISIQPGRNLMNQLNIRLGYRVHTKSVHKIIPLLICSECNTGMQVSRHDNRDQFKKRERERAASQKTWNLTRTIIPQLGENHVPFFPLGQWLPKRSNASFNINKWGHCFPSHCSQLFHLAPKSNAANKLTTSWYLYNATPKVFPNLTKLIF